MALTLVKGVSARFLHYKVTIFLFVTSKLQFGGDTLTLYKDYANNPFSPETSAY